MARKARKQSKTGYYHLMVRGNNREKVFLRAIEKQYFLKLVQHQVDNGKILIVAYCLMDNHAHFLIHSDLLEMSEAFKWINIKFAGMYNNKYKRVGHVFQDRYRSEVINIEGHIIRVMRYIHNNPIKARIVAKPSDYQWSSYKSYVDKKDNLVSSNEKQMIMDLFSDSMEQFVEFHSEEETHEFLETEEDIELEREEKALIIIDKYCQQHEIIANELRNNKDVLEKVVNELIETNYLSHRRIAGLLGITRGMVHNVAKKKV
jgi:putative transposase